MFSRALANVVKNQSGPVALGLVLTSILISLVLIGTGWLSYAAVVSLTAHYDQATALVIVGAVCLGLVATVVAILWLRHRSEEHRAHEETNVSLAALLPQLLNTTQEAARQHPLAVIFTCVAAGVVASAKPDLAKAVVSVLAQSLQGTRDEPQR